MKKIMSIDEMRQFITAVDKEEEREALETFNNKIDEFNFGVVKNYNVNQRKYEAYLFIEEEAEILSPLLVKYSKNKIVTNAYYNKLLKIINSKNKEEIMRVISSKLS